MTTAPLRRWPDPALPDWDGSIAAALEQQVELSRRVIRRDDFATPLSTVAGFDVGFEDDRAAGDRMIVRATAVLLDADTLEVLDRQVARMPASLAYAPDLLGFLGLPALFAVLQRLPRRPDLAFVDGHGIAHPRRFGIAAHFGVAADLPAIGVSDEVLVGTFAALHEIRGAHTPLRDHGEQVGWLLRSKVGGLPLVVSPGHRVSMTAAAQMVMRYVESDRLPLPTRLAGDSPASR
jgi:deoxyribonuclease V